MRLGAGDGGAKPNLLIGPSVREKKTCVSSRDTSWPVRLSPQYEPVGQVVITSPRKKDNTKHVLCDQGHHLDFGHYHIQHIIRVRVRACGVRT
jgi:hypothetical protein